MNLLAVDTSTRSCSVALKQGRVIAAEWTLELEQTHARHVMGVIESLLNAVSVSLEQIDAYAVVNGPGSFTGLRIGIATVKGFAFAFDKPVIGVSSLAAMAYPFSGAPGLICSAIDARKKEIYAELYRWTADAFKSVVPACVIPPERMVQRVSEMNEPCRFVGSGAALYRDLLVEGLCGMASFAPSAMNRVQAGIVAEMAETGLTQGRGGSADDLAPVYLRRPDAERNRLRRGV